MWGAALMKWAIWKMKYTRVSGENLVTKGEKDNMTTLEHSLIDMRVMIKRA